MEPEKERASKKIWDRAAWKDAGFFLTYLRPHYRVFIPALFALALTGALTILFIKELSALVGKGIGGATGAEWMAELNDAVWFLVAIVSIQAFIAFWRILLFAKASERALAALRIDTFSRILRLPMRTLNQRRVGELASRLANDVEAMRETLVSTIPMLIRHSVMLVLCLILILQMSVKLSLFMIATIPVVVVLSAFFRARRRKWPRSGDGGKRYCGSWGTDGS